MTIRSEQISIVSSDGFNANNKPIKNASEVELDSPSLNSNNDPKASATLNVNNDGNVGITIVDRNVPASPVTNTNNELISKDGKIKYNNISRGSDSVSSVANKFLGFNSSGNIGVFNTPATTSIAYTGITNGGSASAAANKLIGFDNAGTATALIGPGGSADANKILKVNATGTGWQLDTLSNTVPYTGITNGGNPTGVANKFLKFDSSGDIQVTTISNGDVPLGSSTGFLIKENSSSNMISIKKYLEVISLSTSSTSPSSSAFSVLLVDNTPTNHNLFSGIGNLYLKILGTDISTITVSYMWTATAPASHSSFDSFVFNTPAGGGGVTIPIVTGNLDTAKKLYLYITTSHPVSDFDFSGYILKIKQFDNFSDWI